MIKSSKRKIEFLKKEYFNITVSQLTGNILELGYDQGDNFKYYNSSCNVIAIDKKKVNINTENNINVIQKDVVDKLPFNNNYFDYVVFTFFLCTITDKENVIKEIHRVLKKNGQIIYLEHVASNSSIYHLTQIFLSPITKTIFNNCSLNNRIRPFLEKYFKIKEIEEIENYIEPYEFGIWLKKHST